MKHKLEHANGMVKAMKDELERSRKRLDELQLKESNLKVDVSRLQKENAKLQAQFKALSRKGAPAPKS
jgi:predicted  nucleic acid-binding Zn-ribbon protein